MGACTRAAVADGRRRRGVGLLCAVLTACGLSGCSAHLDIAGCGQVIISGQKSSDAQLAFMGSYTLEFCSYDGRPVYRKKATYRDAGFT